MPMYGFDEQAAQRIVRAVKQVERNTLGNVNQPPGQRLDYPIPMFPAKLNATISPSCSGAVIIWGATQASTVAEATLTTSEVAHDWFGLGGTTGDKVMLFRQYGSERLHFLKEFQVLGKLDAEMSSTTTGISVSVWKSSTGGAPADTGANIVALNFFLESGDTPLASGSRVVCSLIGGYYFVTNARCST